MLNGPEPKVLTFSALLTILGRRSRQSIYGLMRRNPSFPRPRQIGSEFSVLWTDGDGQVLEDQIEEIAVSLVAYAEWAYRWGIERRYELRVERKGELEERIRKQKEEAEKKERARIEKAAAERREKLISDTGAWRRAAEIRTYVEAQLARWSDADAETVGGLHTWVAWARAEADAINPLRAGPPRPVWTTAG